MKKLLIIGFTFLTLIATSTYSMIIPGIAKVQNITKSIFKENISYYGILPNKHVIGCSQLKDEKGKTEYQCLVWDEKARETSPIIGAQAKENFSLLELLYKKEQKEDAKENQNESTSKALMFMEALRNNEIEKAKKLFDKDIDVKAKDIYKDTPLHLAAFRGLKEIVEQLIALGAHINETNSYGSTPLHHAASGRHKDIVEILIKAGADVNVKDKLFDHKPLDNAIIAGDRDSVKTLINAESDVNSVNKLGETPLLQAIDQYSYLSRRSDIIKLLIDAKANVNAVKTTVDNKGDTPLIKATKKGLSDVVELLLKAGADVNAPDSLGRTAYFWAEINKNSDIENIIKKFGGKTL